MEVTLIFPHQLDRQSKALDKERKVFIIEHPLFFTQYAFHKQKLAFHRASMQCLKNELIERGYQVDYIEHLDNYAKLVNLIDKILEEGASKIHVTDLVDDWLEKELKKTIKGKAIDLLVYDSNVFLNARAELSFFENKSRFFQTKFYKQQRKQRDILMNGAEPAGDKWTFDKDNRKKYPAKTTPPSISFPNNKKLWNEAENYVGKHFRNNPGTIESQYYPVCTINAQKWLDQFLEKRFDGFGTYEDAIVKEELVLHHSVLSPLMNVGLLSAKDIIEQSISYAQKNKVPLNDVEGFIRQIIGWREFIRGLYIHVGRKQRISNFWGFNRKIPKSFYEGTTGIEPLDITIKKVLKTGYAHHIERLMILGNFMLLCEFHPNEVYRWFMELFIDAYDWVMVPNVYGMSQFADGGLMSTKPYISGSNYIIKMSNYKKGDWSETWDALFWRFMHVHRDVMGKNPRMGMLIKSWDKKNEEERSGQLMVADQFLNSM